MTLEKIMLYWLALTAALIGVAPRLLPICIVILAILVVVGYVKKQLVFQWSWPATLLTAFYAAYLTGTFFTNDEELAAHYLESKISFVVFPALLSFRFRHAIDFRPVVLGLTAGIIIASVLGFANAFSAYQKTGWLLESFTSSSFSHLHHPSYFCVFILTSAALLWHGYRQQWTGFRPGWILPLFAYYLFIYALCLSLAGMLFLFGLGAIISLRLIRKRFGWKGFAVAVVIVPLLIGGLFSLMPRMKLQFNDASTVFMDYSENPTKFIRSRTGIKEGNEVRLIMWMVAAQELAAHPMGVGTGNVDAHLSARLLAYGQLEMGKKDTEGHILLNPHNQYLQTGMEIGVIGLMLLIALFVSLFRIAWKYRNTVLAILAAGFAFNCLFESMLQRQSGIVFLSFWVFMLIVWLRSGPAHRQRA